MKKIYNAQIIKASTGQGKSYETARSALFQTFTFQKRASLLQVVKFWLNKCMKKF